MVVAGGEFQVHAADFHFLGRVLDAQVREADLAVSHGEVQFACERFFHPMGLTLALRLGLTKFSIELFLKLVIELHPEYLATLAFDLVGSLLIQAVQGGIMVYFLGLHKARVDGLIVEYEAVATNQAFTLLCERKNLLRFGFENIRLTGVRQAVDE